MVVIQLISSFLFLFSLFPFINAAALTTQLAANERLCFYADVDKVGEKIGVSLPYPFRNALSISSTLVLFCSASPASSPTALYHNYSLQVQSGGSFDIDFDVKDPKDKLLLEGHRERQGDYVLTANTVGEYVFCFENDISTVTPKLIDFDIMVESEPRREAPAKPGQISDQTSALEESVFRLQGMLLNIKRLQQQCVQTLQLYFSQTKCHYAMPASIQMKIEDSQSSGPRRSKYT